MVPLYWLIKAPAIVYNRYKEDAERRRCEAAGIPYQERSLTKELCIGLLVTFLMLAVLIGLPLVGLALIILLLG